MGREARTGAHLVTFDPQELTLAQCDGDACVVCHKRWPRPRVPTGRLPDERVVHACDDCAEAIAPLPPRSPAPAGGSGGTGGTGGRGGRRPRRAAAAGLPVR